MQTQQESQAGKSGAKCLLPITMPKVFGDKLYMLLGHQIVSMYRALDDWAYSYNIQQL